MEHQLPVPTGFSIPDEEETGRLYRLCKMIAESGLAPRDVATPQRLMVIMLHARELGIPPMMALQRIAVINNRPSLWGDGVVSVVMRSGLLEVFDEWLEGDPYQDTYTAYCRVKRKGIDSVRTGEYSVADAKTAGLWNKRGRDGSPTPWQQYPKRMLQMRARVVFRDLFADVLSGLYLAEELIGTETAPSQFISKVKQEVPAEVSPSALTAPGIPTAGEDPEAATPSGPTSLPSIPEPPPLQQPDALDEILDQDPDPPDLLDDEPPDPISQWKDTLATASYDEAVRLFETTIYKAQERDQISRAQLEELQDLVLKRGNWR